MSLISKILSFSRTSQGRRLADRAQRYAQSPEGRRRISEARQRVGRGRSRGSVNR